MRSLRCGPVREGRSKNLPGVAPSKLLDEEAEKTEKRDYQQRGRQRMETQTEMETESESGMVLVQFHKYFAGKIMLFVLDDLGREKGAPRALGPFLVLSVISHYQSSPQ